MGEVAVSESKLLILLAGAIIVAIAIGFVFGKLTSSAAPATEPVTAGVQAATNPVEAILQDSRLTDPANSFTNFTTELLFAHTIAGMVVNLTEDGISLRVNQTVLRLQRTPTTAYFLRINGTRTLTTPNAVKVGDSVTFTQLVHAEDHRPAGILVSIVR